MKHKAFWNRIYQDRALDDVSWHQFEPTTSLILINATLILKNQAVIDVGGGTSRLVDHLLAADFEDLAVLDISPVALEQTRKRLGKRAQDIKWCEISVIEFRPLKPFALWHDRAVFHFLTSQKTRSLYVESLKRALMPDGHVIIATFAPDGPAQCSGLDIIRYDAEKICRELGSEFHLLETIRETHLSPSGVRQKFNYFRFVRVNEGPVKTRHTSLNSLTSNKGNQ